MLEKQQASVWNHVHTLHYIRVASIYWISLLIYVKKHLILARL